MYVEYRVLKNSQTRSDFGSELFLSGHHCAAFARGVLPESLFGEDPRDLCSSKRKIGSFEAYCDDWTCLFCYESFFQLMVNCSFGFGF